MDLALLYSQLIRIESLDIWKGLAHVGCRKEVYADALRLFCGDLENITKPLMEFMEQEKWEEYSAAIHALKGGLAGIGAWELARKASDLENASQKKDHQFCRANSTAMFSEITELAESLKSTALFDEVIIKKEQVQVDFLEKNLNELYWACSSGKSVEADALAKELQTKICGGEIDNTVTAICTHIANLDYHLVIQILENQPYIKKPSP